MKKTMKRLSALLIGMMIELSSAMAVYADEGYTYNYDYWGDIQYSPDAYEVSGVYSDPYPASISGYYSCQQ